MAYGRCALIDPDPSPSGLGTYEWQINYSEDAEFGGERGLEVMPTTDGQNFVMQQGSERPLVKSVSGVILHENQHAEFAAFYKKSRRQTLIFRDFTGDEYEVLITAYMPTMSRTLWNSRDPSIPRHFYRYTLTMQVLRVVSGVWE